MEVISNMYAKYELVTTCYSIIIKIVIKLNIAQSKTVILLALT